MDSFHEIKSEIVTIDPSSLPSLLPLNRPVHFSAPLSRANVEDTSFGIFLDNSLKLRRQTEYCQWNEFATDQCETCTRSLQAKDGTTSTESYSCNCVRQYSYLKNWQSFRINSLLFNQPAAHYNPQRDPYPSSEFASHDAEVGVLQLSPALVNHIRAPDRKVIWTNTAQREPKWYDYIFHPVQRFFGWKDNSRYEYFSRMIVSFRGSVAFLLDNFLYIGDGYFYSPFEASMHMNVLKYFMEWVEGSLFDWQLGDIVHSCQAGDIRVHFSVKVQYALL